MLPLGSASGPDPVASLVSALNAQAAALAAATAALAVIDGGTP